MTPMSDASILIVDDEDANVALLERMLRTAGYSNLTSTTDSRLVPALFAKTRPDLMLLDLHMPHFDGFETLNRVAPLIAKHTYFPILVLTADITREARERALSTGARDFVTKPFDLTEVLLRIQNLLQARSLHIAIANKAEESSRAADEARLETLRRLAYAVESRDDETGEHVARVGKTAGLIAIEMGLDAEIVEAIRAAAPLHDVGKIGVADAVLQKPGALTAEEFEQMRAHTIIGAGMLSGSPSSMVQMAAGIALTHHERWDGEGYPRGLKGEEIPLAGRIVAVADVFDAMTHRRRYKEAMPHAEACAEITVQAGRQFDPRVVAAFLATLESRSTD